MDISLITSLYRSAAHLPAFTHHALEVAQGVRAAGLTLEFVIVANEASAEEREQIERFAAQYPDVKALYVPRETIYASWNRGVEVASGRAIGFWNVDDVRTVEGLIDGHKRITAGSEVVYFSYDVHETNGQTGDVRDIHFPAVPFDRVDHLRKYRGGPFFMFHRPLYDRVGRFDERFTIVGDYDWCVRAMQQVELTPSPVVAGRFWMHGGNVSASSNPLMPVEDNIVHLLYGDYQHLKPADPELMRKTWEKWASSAAIPTEVADRLWGQGAQQWREAYERNQKRAAFVSKVRRWPKMLIDRAGLRASLARIGLVKARS